ncbi:beta-lactamase class A-like protein [Bifidobacterium goeldii]|uniref:Beta-lactamase class A-like protein n=1 Tax=Bifidobacterium goeldii TaxID=2306975 RepID=A0A430FJK7_9BIFI|nr:beta-lactamase class A-like protein [Bifidobacterium goeldii]
MRFCIHCGQPLEPGSKFCTHCGASVDTSTPQTSTAPTMPGAVSASTVPTTPSTPTAPTTPVVPTASSTTPPWAAAPATPTTSVNPVAPQAPNAVPPMPNFLQPTTPASPNGAPSPYAPAKTQSKGKIIGIVAGAIAAILVIVIVLVWQGVISVPFLGDKQQSATQSATSSSSTDDTSSKAKTQTKKKTEAKKNSDAATEAQKAQKNRLTAKSLSLITDRYSSTDVSVSAMYLGDGSSAASSNTSSADIANTSASRTQFVSAGLYLPVYLVAQANGGSALASAQDMMSTMSNDSANQAIADCGGFDAINQWLAAHSYADTTLGRNFGDVQASNAGYENYSSTFDAVRMLAAVDAAGAANLMNVDIAAEGVTIPAGMTVHAHRGQGIKDTWNYFAIVSTSHGKAAVALATQNQGKETAAQIMSDVLADIDSQLAKANE